MKITAEISESTTLKFNQIVREMVAKGEKIISLGLGEPVFETPLEIIEETIKALKDGFTKYSDSMGLMPLRENISKKFETENNFSITPNNIAVTLGAKQALQIALMSILRPGDEVINFTPCYVSYIPQIKIAEPDAIIKNIDFNKDDFTINIEKLKSTLTNKTKAIIFNSPNNPLGRVFSVNEMNAFVNILFNYPNCYIISDEVYEYLNFSNIKHISFQSYQEISNRVFTINGFSKSFAMTGWRIGYMSFPNEYKNIIIKLLQHMNTNIPTFIQKGVIKAFEIDKGFINNYNLELKKSAEYIYSSFLNKKITVVKPEGGFFAFANILQTGYPSDLFASTLLTKYNVALNPGISFGENWDDHIRISFAGNHLDVQEGIMRILDFVS